MKQVLTQSDVAKAISDLVAQGKKPTMAAIHAAVGKGSMSTLHRIKTEIDAMVQTQPATDSPEAQQAFRTVWNLAVDQGRKQNEAIVAEMRDDIRTLAVENERQEGDASLWQNRAAELEKSQVRAEADRQAAQSALCEASAQSARALQQLADAQADHASQTRKLQADLDEALRKAHDLELELVRARALMEARGMEAAQA
jgi:hypothetical protein